MSEQSLPEDVVDEAERLTRLTRRATDESEAEAYRERRDGLVAEYGYIARVRESDDVLVLHPAEWVSDGVANPERIEDLDRGVERPLTDAGDAEAWDAVDARNRQVVAKVGREHGEDHAANVSALADFMSNHYAKPIADATTAEVTEFVEEYYPRNAWPTDSQQAVLELSLELAFEAAGTEPPTGVRR